MAVAQENLSDLGLLRSQQRNDKQSKNQNADTDIENKNINANKNIENENLSDKGKIQKARLLNRKLNQLKTKVSEIHKNIDSAGRAFTFGAYRFTGDPAIAGATYGLSIIAWWPIHFIGKYMGNFPMFSKFTPLSEPWTMSVEQVIKNKEKSSIPSFVILGVAIGFYAVLIAIASLIIVLVLRAGRIASIWDIVADPIQWVKGLESTADLIRVIIKP